jgi:hypothetical protein
VVTKEEVFKSLTKLILELKDKTKFEEHPELIDDWKSRQKAFSLAFNSLSTCDHLWLSEKYEIWFRQQFGDPSVLQAHLTKSNLSDIIPQNRPN